MTTTSLTSLVVELAGAGIELFVVGGLAAVAQGAPLATFDVDVVHRRSGENVDLLLRFLADHHAYYRGRPRGQRLAPAKSALLGAGHQLLMTDLGPLDLLGAIEGDATYEDLEADAIELPVGGQTVLVLRLSRLVSLKRQSKHPKDLKTLRVLEKTLERIESGDEEGSR